MHRSARSALPLLVAVMMASGCSAPHSQIPEAADRQKGLPEWAEQLKSHERRDGHYEFYGAGSDQAAARNDALAQLAQYVGAEITTGSRMMAHAHYDTSDVGEEIVSRSGYTGVDASVFVRGAEFEYAGHNDRLFARMRLSEKDVERAAQAASESYKYQVRRLAEAREKLNQQRHERLGAAAGSAPIFAKATGEASVRARPGQSAPTVERQARRQARHDAQVQLTRQLHGAQTRTLETSSENHQASSTSVSTGRVFSDPLAHRVWWFDQEVHAEVTVFGWSDRSEEEKWRQ